MDDHAPRIVSDGCMHAATHCVDIPYDDLVQIFLSRRGTTVHLKRERRWVKADSLVYANNDDSAGVCLCSHFS